MKLKNHFHNHIVIIILIATFALSTVLSVAGGLSLARFAGKSVLINPKSTPVDAAAVTGNGVIDTADKAWFDNNKNGEIIGSWIHYYIGNPDELAYLSEILAVPRASPNNLDYQKVNRFQCVINITADLDMSAWSATAKPTGTYTQSGDTTISGFRRLTGRQGYGQIQSFINGNGHTIYNLETLKSDSSVACFIDNISGGISNLNFEDVRITSATGGFSCLVNNFTGYHNPISNVKIYSGTIGDSNPSRLSNQAAAFFLNAPNAKLTNCENHANVTASARAAGFFVSSVNETYYETYMKNCANFGNILCTAGGYEDAAAGFVSNLQQQGLPLVLDNCTNYGDVIGNLAGGFIGWGSGLEMKNCANVGRIGAKLYAGGLIGAADVGDMGSGHFISVINSYSSGTLNVNSTNINMSFGGLIGHMLHTIPVSFENCYNSSTLVPGSVAPQWLGGLVGHDGQASMVFTNCYYVTAKGFAKYSGDYNAQETNIGVGNSRLVNCAKVTSQGAFSEYTDNNTFIEINRKKSTDLLHALNHWVQYYGAKYYNFYVKASGNDNYPYFGPDGSQDVIEAVNIVESSLSFYTTQVECTSSTVAEQIIMEKVALLNLIETYELQSITPNFGLYASPSAQTTQNGPYTDGYLKFSLYITKAGIPTQLTAGLTLKVYATRYTEADGAIALAYDRLSAYHFQIPQNRIPATNNLEAIRIWMITEINSHVDIANTTLDIFPYSINPFAVAGTEGDPMGENGTFFYNITIYKSGGQTRNIVSASGTIVATPFDTASSNDVNTVLAQITAFNFTTTQNLVPSAGATTQARTAINFIISNPANFPNTYETIIQITINSIIAAVAGNEGNISGTNGSINFTATVQKENISKSVTKTCVITAIAYDTSYDDEQAVQMARIAILSWLPVVIDLNATETADLTNAGFIDTYLTTKIGELSLNGVSATVTSTSANYTAPITETFTTDGRDGSYLFQFTLSKNDTTMAGVSHPIRIIHVRYDTTAADAAVLRAHDYLVELFSAPLVDEDGDPIILPVGTDMSRANARVMEFITAHYGDMDEFDDEFFDLDFVTVSVSFVAWTNAVNGNSDNPVGTFGAYNFTISVASRRSETKEVWGDDVDGLNTTIYIAAIPYTPAEDTLGTWLLLIVNQIGGSLSAPQTLVQNNEIGSEAYIMGALGDILSAVYGANWGDYGVSVEIVFGGNSKFLSAIPENWTTNDDGNFYHIVGRNGFYKFQIRLSKVSVAPVLSDEFTLAIVKTPYDNTLDNEMIAGAGDEINIDFEGALADFTLKSGIKITDARDAVLLKLNEIYGERLADFNVTLGLEYDADDFVPSDAGAAGAFPFKLRISRAGGDALVLDTEISVVIDASDAGFDTMTVFYIAGAVAAGGLLLFLIYRVFAKRSTKKQISWRVEDAQLKFEKETAMAKLKSSMLSLQEAMAAKSQPAIFHATKEVEEARALSAKFKEHEKQMKLKRKKEKAQIAKAAKAPKATPEELKAQKEREEKDRAKAKENEAIVSMYAAKGDKPADTAAPSADTKADDKADVKKDDDYKSESSSTSTSDYKDDYKSSTTPSDDYKSTSNTDDYKSDYKDDYKSSSDYKSTSDYKNESSNTTDYKDDYKSTSTADDYKSDYKSDDSPTTDYKDDYKSESSANDKPSDAPSTGTTTTDGKE
jgi:outer membrane biosynthesis protein TonB